RPTLVLTSPSPLLRFALWRSPGPCRPVLDATDDRSLSVCPRTRRPRGQRTGEARRAPVRGPSVPCRPACSVRAASNVRDGRRKGSSPAFFGVRWSVSLDAQRVREDGMLFDLLSGTARRLASGARSSKRVGLEGLEPRLVPAKLMQVAILGLPASGQSPEGTTITARASVTDGSGSTRLSWALL